MLSKVNNCNIFSVIDFDEFPDCLGGTNDLDAVVN